MKYTYLKAQDWFHPKIKRKNHKITIGDNSKRIQKIFNIIKTFLLRASDPSKYLAGIDFEFNRVNNKRQIALCQINLEDVTTEADIVFFDPKMLNKSQMGIFKKLLVHNKVSKILHGGESLDLPYLFNNVLTTLKEQKQFSKNFFDTKFLCDFYNLKEKGNIRCKINYLNHQMGVITKKQFDYLQTMEEKMGYISSIKINVKKMSDLLILYTLTDVLYLPSLIKRFPNNILYRKILPQMTCFVIILKMKTNNLADLVNYISKFNIYYLKSDYGKINLVEIYSLILYMIYDKMKIFHNLLDINYFKKSIELIVKFYLYNEIINNYEVWVNKTKKLNKKINIKKLNIMKEFSHIYKYFSKIYKGIKKIII